jgi:L-fucose isomerase-like protein
MNRQQKIVLGVIVGNRNFFPDSLITQGRQDVLDVLKEQDIDAVILDEQATKLGAVETWENAQKCAALFDENRHRIDGILVTLPNFGDEKGVAETIKLSSLRVPILIQAYPDDLGKFALERRRDAFCGKISVCNNLYQYGFPFSLTELHTVNPKTDSFRTDSQKRASGRRRSATQCIQYHPLQRETASGIRYQRQHG